MKKRNSNIAGVFLILIPVLMVFTVAGMPPSLPREETTPQPIPCRIVFETDRDGNSEIYVMEPDGSNPINLTNNPANDNQPAWSPDGNRIAFVSNRDAGEEGGQAIYVMNADGSDVRQLTFNHWSTAPAWSNDGNQITYSSDDDIFILNIDGSDQPVNLTNSTEKDDQPAWSPDGSTIAWLSQEQGGWNINTISPDGTNRQKLTHNGKVHQVQWTVDGQLFSFWDHPEGICQKCVMNADGSGVKEAGGKGELNRFLPFRTVEGHRVECISGENNSVPNSEVYLVGEMYPEIFLNLTKNPANDSNPDWPAKCLSGFKEAIPERSANPEIKPTDPPQKMVFGYAGDKGMHKERARDMQIACDELGIECIFGEIPELLKKGVKAIIQNADTDTVKGLNEEIKNARDNGIPVFLLGAETDTDGAYSITIDYNEWARTSFEWMLEKIGGKGEIAYFDLDPTHRYSDMIKNLLSKYPDITVVEFRDGDYDPGKIKPETGDFVKQYPGLKAIWSSYSSFQGMWALEENSIPYDKWPVMVCEANREGLVTWQRAQTAFPGFDCFASVNPPGIAYAAIYAAYYLESGHQIDESILEGEYGRTLYVDLPTVTKENFQDKLDEMLKNDTHVVDDLMTPENIKEKWFIE